MNAHGALKKAYFVSREILARVARPTGASNRKRSL